jgi:NAD(P)-dependent dehydrogenase (short-subunit alcohol dehydrogenase family)
MLSSADGSLTVPVAVVTGASAGVGRATAVALAAAGYDVALLARGAAGLQGAAEEVSRRGRRALAIPTDVADPTQVGRAAARVEAELGPMDVWVNDAMTTVFAPSWDVAPEDFRRAIEVTFLGQVWGTQAALEHMRPRDRGTIVNVGSALAHVAIPLQSAYCAAKFACRGYFESVRAELIHEGSRVRMSMVHLPAVNTPQFDWCATTMPRHPRPVAPIYQPEKAAEAIVRMARRGRREKVLGSWNKALVAVGKLSPALANRYAAIGAWEAQLTDQPLSPDRPVNLRHPVDADEDKGAHGGFDDQAGGFWDPAFLKTLPSTVAKLGRAASGVVREKLT